MTDEVIQTGDAKCETCGKTFKNERALRIHRGHVHIGKPLNKVTSKPAAKSKDTPKARKAAKKEPFACEFCNKSFSMAAHLGRHMNAVHPKAAAPKKAAKKTRKIAKKAVKTAKPAAAAAPAAPAAVAASPDLDVRAMTVDQLLTLKAAVDARLADIVKAMRAAKVAL